MYNPVLRCEINVYSTKYISAHRHKYMCTSCVFVCKLLMNWRAIKICTNCMNTLFQYEYRPIIHFVCTQTLPEPVSDTESTAVRSSRSRSVLVHMCVSILLHQLNFNPLVKLKDWIFDWLISPGRQLQKLISTPSGQKRPLRVRGFDLFKSIEKIRVWPEP